MSLMSPRNQAVFALAERERLEPPDDAHDFLADKPEGFCPWCGQRVENMERPSAIGRRSRHEWILGKDCKEWDVFEWQDKNRARYVTEQEADAKLESRISRELSRRDEDF